jgi:hypothetical protein
MLQVRILSPRPLTLGFIPDILWVPPQKPMPSPVCWPKTYKGTLTMFDYCQPSRPIGVKRTFAERAAYRMSRPSSDSTLSTFGLKRSHPHRGTAASDYEREIESESARALSRLRPRCNGCEPTRAECK